MNHAEFMNELAYFICRAALLGLYNDGLISDYEYSSARVMLLDRYHPVLGSLF